MTDIKTGDVTDYMGENAVVLGVDGERGQVAVQFDDKALLITHRMFLRPYTEGGEKKND